METSSESIDALLARGEHCAQLDEHERALAAFSRALDISSTLTPALIGKTTALIHLERYREALDTALWAEDHASHYLFPSLCAQALHGLRRDEEALRMIDRALWLGPKDAHFHQLRGAILFGLARDEEAIQAFESALQSYTDAHEDAPPVVQVGLQEARERAARRGRSLAVLARRRVDHPEDSAFWSEVAEQLRELDQDDAADSLDGTPTREQLSAVTDALIATVDRSLVRDHPEGALALYNRVLEIDPDRPPVLYSRANVLYALQRPAEALDMVAMLPAHMSVNHSEGWFVRGQILRATGRLEQALECYGRAISYAPWMETWRREQADLLVQMGRDEEARAPQALAELFSGLGTAGHAGSRSSPHAVEEALAHFERAVALDPTLRFAQGEAAAALVALGRHDEALARLATALARAPMDAYLRVVQANALRAAGRPQDALAAFDRALDLLLVNIGWTGKAAALAAMDRVEEAQAALEQALELDDEDEAAWALRSQLLAQAGRDEEALSAINQALKWERLLSMEDHIELERIEISTAGTRLKQALDMDARLDVYRAKVAILRRLARDDEAQHVAAVVSRSEAEPYRRHAQRAFGEHRYAEALTAFEHALTIDPTWRWGWLAKGDTLAALGRDDEALAAFRESLANTPDNLRELYNRANTLTNEHRYDQAMALLEIALAAWPSHEEWWHLSSHIPKHHMEAYLLSLKGKVLSETDQYAEALEWQQRAVELAPDQAFVWRNKGRALSQLQRWDEAAADFTRALALDDSAAYDWHSLAYALYKGGQYEEAMVAIERAIELDPTPPIVGTKGQIYLRLGHLEQALEWLDRALAADPSDREHWSVKAEALHALGRESEARAAERRAAGTL